MIAYGFCSMIFVILIVKHIFLYYSSFLSSFIVTQAYLYFCCILKGMSHGKYEFRFQYTIDVNTNDTAPKINVSISGHIKARQIDKIVCIVLFKYFASYINWPHCVVEWSFWLASCHVGLEKFPQKSNQNNRPTWSPNN